MRETGIIVKVDGPKLSVHLTAARPEMCHKCGACEILGEGRHLVMTLPQPGDLQVGEVVLVEVPEVSPWTGMVLVFGVPMALMVGGLILGSRWAGWYNLLRIDPELAGAALGVLLGLAGFAVARTVDRRYSAHIAVRRAEPGETAEPLESLRPTSEAQACGSADDLER